jgi:hypothetical protein
MALQAANTFIGTLTSDGSSGAKTLTGAKQHDTIIKAYVENYSGGGYNDFTAAFEGFISVDDQIQESAALATGNTVKIILVRVRL